MSLQTRASLLGLPKKVRAKILRETGLVREYPIAIFSVPNSVQKSFGRVQINSDNFDPPNQQPVYEPFPFQLFQICSKLYAEVFGLFYGENKFRVNYGDHELVTKLREFPPNAWANMRNLAVYYGLERSSPGLPKYIDRVLTFKSLCQILSKGLIPYQTTISILFDARTSGEASLLLDHASNLPLLANVRLHITASLDGITTLWEKDRLNHWSTEIKTLLGAISRKLTRKPCVPFQFLQLPVELQLMVLSYTGLVVSTPTMHDGIPICAKLSTAGRCCGNCKDKGNVDYPPYATCWCSRDLLHSTTCTCNQHLSNALFATSKTIRQQALKIAFGENKFSITHRPWKSIEDTAETFSLIPPNRLQWIKHLTIDFEELHLHRNSGQLVRFLIVVHRLCAPRKLHLKLRFPHYFSFHAEALKLVYATISELAFANIKIQVPHPARCQVMGRTGLRFHVSSPPRDVEMVTVLGGEVEQDVDEVVGELMQDPRYYY